MTENGSKKPAPSATGQLLKTPVANLLVYAADKRLSGTMEFAHPNGPTAALSFREGQIAKARTSEPVAHLGKILFDLGAISKEVLEETQKAKVDDGGLHGQILLQKHAVTEEQLQLGLDRQLVSKLDYIFTLPKATTYAFFDGVDLLAGYGGKDPIDVRLLDPHSVLWRGLCLNPPWPQVDAALEKLRTGRIRTKAETELGSLGLNPDVQAFVESRLHEPCEVEEFIAGNPIPPHTAKLVAFCLVVTKRVEVLAAGAEAFGPPSSTMMRAIAPAATPGAGETAGTAPGVAQAAAAAPAVQAIHAPDVAARIATMRAFGTKIETLNYFEMLGVPETAPKEAVDDAYRELAKQWHPDRLSPDMSEVKEIAARVFGLLADARKTLGDEGERTKYMKLVREGGATPEAQAYIGRVIDAATTFQKADICFRRGDMAQALDLCKRAAEGDPTQSDYVALQAWIESMDPKSQDPASTRERIAMLDRALSINARSDRAHYYRGMLYKKLGDSKLALIDMRKAVELNPRNAEAPREVRLLESRQLAAEPEARSAKKAEGPPASKLSGLFNKILKK